MKRIHTFEFDDGNYLRTLEAMRRINARPDPLTAVWKFNPEKAKYNGDECHDCQIRSRYGHDRIFVTISSILTRAGIEAPFQLHTSYSTRKAFGKTVSVRT
jgi:hypothetical protein